MPVHKVKGGFKWGQHGHTYPTKAGAEKQAAAIFANGYRGDKKISGEDFAKLADKEEDDEK